MLATRASASVPAPFAVSIRPSTTSGGFSRFRLWAGRIITGMVTLFALFDAVTKVALTRFSVDATVQLGYQPHHVQLIGFLALACLLVYLIPRTAPLGAVLWTGYLGGAVASNIRLDEPLFSHTLFPVYFAVLLWVGLYLRDARLRAFLVPPPPDDR